MPLCLLCSNFVQTSVANFGNPADDFDPQKIGKQQNEFQIYSSITKSTKDSKFDALFVLNEKDEHQKEADIIRKSVAKSGTGNDLQKSQHQVKEVRECYIVQKVDGIPITNIDVVNALRFIFLSAGAQYDEKTASLLVNSVITSLTDKKLHKICADSIGIKITDEDLTEKIEEIAKANNLTVEQFASKFEQFGLTMNLFKKELKAKMLLFFVAEAISGMTIVSPQEISEEKQKAAEGMQHARFHLLEIFFRIDDQRNSNKIKQNAESILQLIKTGFNFRVLSENLSQGNYSNVTGDLGFVVDSKLEKSVKDAVKQTPSGSVTPVLKTNYGYKIICVLDKAEPKKAPESSVIYDVVKTKLEFKIDGLSTSNDKKKYQSAVAELFEAKNIDTYKSVCEKYHLAYEEQKIDKNMPYEMHILSEQVRREKLEQKVVLFKPQGGQEGKEEIVALFLVGMEVGDACLPTDNDIFRKVSAKKVRDYIALLLKRMRRQISIEQNSNGSGL